MPRASRVSYAQLPLRRLSRHRHRLNGGQRRSRALGHDAEELIGFGGRLQIEGQCCALALARAPSRLALLAPSNFVLIPTRSRCAPAFRGAQPASCPQTLV